MKRLRLMLLALLLVTNAMHAFAGGSPKVSAEEKAAIEQATKRHQSAVRHYDLGELNEALADFKEAYRAFPDASILYNLGQTYRRLGDVENAASSYDLFLRRARDVTPERRAALLQFIADARKIAPTTGDPPAGRPPSPTMASPAAPSPSGPAGTPKESSSDTTGTKSSLSPCEQALAHLRDIGLKGIREMMDECKVPPATSAGRKE